MKNKPVIGDYFDFQKHLIDNFEDIDVQLNDIATVSFTRFGGVNDGITDNASKFTEVFEYARTKGVDVFLPKGIYAINNSITLLNVKMYGEKGTVIKFTSTDYAKHKIVLDDNSALCGIEVTTDKIGSRFGGAFGVNPIGDNITVENCNIHNLLATGIIIQGATNVRILNNSVHDTLADGIHTNGGANNIIVKGNIVYNTGDDGIASVTYASESGVNNHMLFEGNHIYNGNSRGVTVVGTNNAIVSNNTIDSCKNSGMFLGSDSGYATNGSDGITVTGNIIKDCGSSVTTRQGIYVNGDVVYKVDNVIIANNTISNNNATSSIYTSTSFGISLTKICNVTIRNNIFSNLGNGIRITTNMYGGYIINNNTFTNTGRMLFRELQTVYDNCFLHFNDNSYFNNVSVAFNSYLVEDTGEGSDRSKPCSVIYENNKAFFTNAPTNYNMFYISSYRKTIAKNNVINSVKSVELNGTYYYDGTNYVIDTTKAFNKTSYEENVVLQSNIPLVVKLNMDTNKIAYTINIKGSTTNGANRINKTITMALFTTVRGSGYCTDLGNGYYVWYDVTSNWVFDSGTFSVTMSLDGNGKLNVSISTGNVYYNATIGISVI